MIYRVPCSKVASALLGSCTVQSELGDYDVDEHGSGIDYIRDIQFTPDQTDELLMKIAEMHQTQLQSVRLWNAVMLNDYTFARSRYII